MSDGSDHIPIIHHLSRFLFHLFAWLLWCRMLNRIVSPVWAFTALPVAAASGYMVFRAGLRTLPALGLLALLPWVLRLAILAASPASTLPVTLDNAWYLTAPLLYFTTFSFYLGSRYPVWGYSEAMLLGACAVLLLRRDGLWPPTLPVPSADTLNLLLAVLTVILMLFMFVTARFGGALVHSGFVRPPRGGRPVSSMFYLMVLSAFLVLLFLGGNRIRREQSVQSGGGLLASEMFRFDFNEVLTLEPEINLNGELTMLYREDGPPTVRYLRRFTLSGWTDEKGFFRDGERETDYPDRPGVMVPVPVTLPRGVETWSEGDYLGRSLVEQEYYLIALDPQSFFALNYPVYAEPWNIWDDASFSRAYAVQSMESVAGPWELMESSPGKLPGSVLDYYLKGGSDVYFRGLADEITAGLETGWEKVSAVENWFLGNFYYSLRPGVAPDGDQLGWFLKESKKGYCSYFAFAMARICRAAGIPARVAVGFLTDPGTSALGFVPVRSDQAHAWVEVWFDEYGWITFDPTSGTMAPGEEYPFEFLSPDKWLSLIEEVLTRSGEVSIALAPEDETSDPDRPWWNRFGSLVKRRPALPVFVSLFLILAVYFPRRILPGIRLLRYLLSRNPRYRTMGSWKLFGAYLTRCGSGPDGRETPLRWAERTEKGGFPGLAEWTGLYLKAEFSPVFGQTDLQKVRELEKSVRKYRKNLNFMQVFSGVAGPGWMRVFPWQF